MGQYYLPVCLDKKEFIDPHKLGCGLKAWEMLANDGVGRALVVLCLSAPERRGGGDLEPADNVIGRWAGCGVAIVGDYAEDSDLPAKYEASKIYNRCQPETIQIVNNISAGASWKASNGFVHEVITKPSEYLDITDLVVKVIEKELAGKYVGIGWKKWKYNGEEEKT